MNKSLDGAPVLHGCGENIYIERDVAAEFHAPSRWWHRGEDIKGSSSG